MGKQLTEKGQLLDTLHAGWADLGADRFSEGSPSLSEVGPKFRNFMV